MQSTTIEIPDKLIAIFDGKADFRGAYGGRGSGKTFSFAKILAYIGASKKVRIVCGREIQQTITDSVFFEVKNAIESCPVLSGCYEIGRTFIRGLNGTEFLFRGLRHNIAEIKGLGQIDYVWIDEAEAVSEESWRELIPTIRKEGSEIWATWNPKRPDAKVHRLFVEGATDDDEGGTKPIIKSVKINWRDNPWFPKKLNRERLRHKQNDPTTYNHVWEGDFFILSDAQVLNGKWEVKEFTPQFSWGRPYFGADFGFSQDPSTLVKCWVFDDCLWIEYEAWGQGVELNDYAAFYDQIPQSRNNPIYADNSRPETISHIKRMGFSVRPCTKWAGSVEDGIAHLRSYRKIYIHPRCEQTAREASLYSYKIDRVTGDISDAIIDDNNHCIDAVRYALDKLITAQSARTDGYTALSRDDDDSIRNW